MIKGIFFDIDGTLLSFNTHKVSIKSLEVLQLLRDKGISLFTATGRHRLDIDHFEGFEFDAYVTLNGQYCFNKEKVIYKNYINKKNINDLISFLETEDFSCMFLEENKIYPNRIGDEIKNLRKVIKFKEYPVQDFSNAIDKEVYQIIAFISKKQEAHFMKNLPDCEITRWHPDFVDIIPKGGSKKNGIQNILDYYNLKASEIMAIGDGENDISMFDLAEISVAMGNASDEVKSHVDYVTTSVDEEGVCSALKHYNIL